MEPYPSTLFFFYTSKAFLKYKKLRYLVEFKGRLDNRSTIVCSYSSFETIKVQLAQKHILYLYLKFDSPKEVYRKCISNLKLKVVFFFLFI